MMPQTERSEAPLAPSLSHLTALVLEKRRTIVRIAAVFATIVAVVMLALPRTYSVEVSVLPIAPAVGGARMAGLAAQFGLAGFGAAAGQSPDFYVSYLRSREIRLQAVERKIAFVPPPPRWWQRSTPAAGRLIDVLGYSDDDSARARELAIEKLASLVQVSTDRLAGTVAFRVRTNWPELSREIAELYLSLLNEFNRAQRTSQAGAERAFVENRLRESRSELAAAERELQQFFEANRTWQSSPALVFQHDRIRRRVDLRQSVVSSLSESFEQARIDEVRDTPVLTVVQPARAPGMPDRRGLVIKVIGAGVLGFLGGVVIVVLLELVTTAKGVERHRRALPVLLHETGTDLRAPWRLIFSRG